MKSFRILAALALVAGLASTVSAQRISKWGTVDVNNAATLADTFTTPTAAVPTGCFLMGYNGTTWDMMDGDATNGLEVQVTTTVPGTGATALGKAEDAAHTTADTGVLVLGVREAAPTDLSAGASDGDYEPFQVDALGKVWVSGTYVEDAGETAGGSLAMAGCVARATKVGSSATASDNATCNLSTTGGLIGASDYQEDLAETGGDFVTLMGAVQRTILVPSAGTTGDVATVNTSALGSLWTEEATRAVAYGSSPTAVAAGVFGAPIADLEGRPYVNTSHPRAVHCHLTTTATVATQVTGCEVVASNSYYVTSVTVTGDIANAVGTPWKITSGTSTDCTGATVILSGYHGTLGAYTATFPTPIKITASHGLCVLDGTTGTKTAMITGYVAP